MSKYPGNIVTTGADTGYSVYFDGSGDYLSVASNAAFAVGTGDFTAECWIYLNSVPGAGTAYPIMEIGTNFYINFRASGTFALTDAVTVYAQSASALVANTWYHVAIVRSSNSSRVYVNGVGGTSVACSVNFAQGAVSVGGSSGAGSLNAYISNFRFVKGTAVYTATFTPPTQLFNVTNTSLLTCNSPGIVDQSSNALTITPVGNAAVSTFTPFTGYTAYNPALGAATPGIWTVSDALQAASTRQWNMYDPYFNYTTLKLGGNGTNGAQNNTFLDSSTNNFTITRNGNTTQGAFTPFSQTGWSNYFDGSSSYISSTIAAPGTGDFTYEFWVYATEHVAPAGEWGMFQTSTTSGGLVTNYTSGVIVVRSGGVFYLNVAGTPYSSSVTIQLNTFYHVAVVRNSGTLYLYINGVNTITPSTNTANLTSTNVAIGGYYSTSYVMKGYISNFRATNAALYTSSFTPPTTPLTSSNANTTLLTCQSNRFADSNTQAAAKTVTPSGTPSVQTFSPFNTNVAYTPTTIGGSGYFDGAGDFLTIPSSTAFDIVTDTFTFDGWVYPTVTDLRIICARRTAGNFGPFQIQQTASQKLGFQYSTNNTSWVSYDSTASLRLNSWNHFAIVRNGANFRIYLNGAYDSGTSSFVNPMSSTSGVAIAAADTSGLGGNYQWIGYISGLRLVKSELYTGTGTYTVPTTPPTPITNTQLLLNFTNAGIVDATAKNVLETAVNAQISTTKSKFGGSSMYFDQSSWLTFAGNLNLAFGTGDYTVEAWVNFSVITASDLQVIFMSGGTGGNNFYFSAKRTQLNVGTKTTFISSQSTTFSANTWYHIAACRSGTTLRLFIDGIQVGSSVTDSTNWISSGLGRVGSDELNAQPAFGYIQDLRITKGYARYITNFTPPTSLLQIQ